MERGIKTTILQNRIVFLTANSLCNCVKCSENYTFYNDSGTESGLADGVDVAGEVEHLVGAAPLVITPGCQLYFFSVFARANTARRRGRAYRWAEDSASHLSSLKS